LYAVFVAPVIALLIRQGVSRQREFLADADAALLTRDPEGLALALVKIGAAGGQRLKVGEGCVHLYFVDPSQAAARIPAWQTWLDGSLLHRFFPSHPPLGERIELLARIGSGIAPEALEAALQAGAIAREARRERVDAHAPGPGPQPDAVPSFSVAETSGGTVGTAPTVVAPSPDEASGPTLTPLYERPDGWSRVLARLPHDAALTAIASEGNFVRVTTRENLLGYVARSAPLSALRALEQTADAAPWKS
jgi:peptidase M48-like protein